MGHAKEKVIAHANSAMTDCLFTQVERKSLYNYDTTAPGVRMPYILSLLLTLVTTLEETVT